MVSCAHVPGVSERSGSGMGRLGRGLPDLASVTLADVDQDMLMEVEEREWGDGVKAWEEVREARRTMGRYFMVQVVVEQSFD